MSQRLNAGQLRMARIPLKYFGALLVLLLMIDFLNYRRPQLDPRGQGIQVLGSGLGKRLVQHHILVLDPIHVLDNVDRVQTLHA